MKEIKINLPEENQRLDKYLLKYLNKSTKSFIYKMIRKKRIKLNNARAKGNELLKSGDSIQLYMSDETINSFMQEKRINKRAGILSVIFEDDNILVCSKPAGVLSHPEKSTDTDTIIDRILLYLSKNNEYLNTKDSTFTPAICNRLDRNTSGIIICGKNLKSVQHINKMFAEKKVDKYYITIVKGIVNKGQKLRGYHIKDKQNNSVVISDKKFENSKEVITEYTPLKQGLNFTLLQVKLITGKSHQIRAHLQKINHEIIGDVRYGNKEVNELLKTKIGLRNQLLHSERIVFKDKQGFLAYLSDKEFKAPIPNMFKKALDFCLGRIK